MSEYACVREAGCFGECRVDIYGRIVDAIAIVEGLPIPPTWLEH